VDEGVDKLTRARDIAHALGAFFERTRVPVIAVRRSGEIVAANDSTIEQYGYSLEELVEMRIHDFQATERPIENDLARAMRGDIKPLDRRAHKRKDGSIAWVVPTAGPIEVDGESLIVSALKDVTALVDAEAQLVSVDRLATIGRLCAGVAHEVNNPAGFVTLALQLLRDQLAKPEKPRAESLTLLDEAFEAMTQINQIMREITGFSRDRARAVTDLTTVANSAIRLALHETRDRARIERVFEDDVTAIVRGSRVAQVVLNLIVNAAQAIKPGDSETNRIEVRAFKDGERACLTVADTGSGVPLALRDRIFEPFFTTRQDSGGTGLGLWLARTIIEEEGGSLSYDAPASGGARFTIGLPLASVALRNESRASR
jgi:PAS domain S-box-containing protein